MSFTPKRVLELYSDARTRKQIYSEKIEECYEFAVPNRECYDYSSEGQDSVDEIYDSTALDSTTKLANRLHSTLTPSNIVWSMLAPGTGVPAQARAAFRTQLDVINLRYYELLWQTNFDFEMAAVWFDAAVGTYSMMVDYYDDTMPCSFTALPAAKLVIEEDNHKNIDRNFWLMKYRAREIENTWPGARIPPALKSLTSKDNDREVELLNAVTRDLNGDYTYQVIHQGDKHEVFKDEYGPESPIITERWSRVPGELYGRGPLYNALADIKSLNKAKELIFKQASLDLLGMYTAVDDGVINPESITIGESEIIPVAANDGPLGATLKPLERGNPVDLAQIILQDLQSSIREKLFDNALAPLDDTVRSAEEVRMRQRLLADQVGPSFGRMQKFLGAIKKRSIGIFQRQGLLPPFEVDGRVVKVQHISPLARAQGSMDLDAIAEGAQRMEQIMPGSSRFAFKLEKTIPYIGEKLGIDQELMASEDDLIKIGQQIGEQAAQGQEILAQ